MRGRPRGRSSTQLSEVDEFGRITTPSRSRIAIPSPAWWFRADLVTEVADDTGIEFWLPVRTDGAVTYGLTLTDERIAKRYGSIQPVYRTGIVNGYPILRFNGTDNWYQTTESSSGAEQTIFAVVRPTTTSGYLAITGGDANGALEVQLDAGRLAAVKQQDSLICRGTNAISTTTFSVVAVTYSESTDAVKCRVNGSEVASNTSWTQTLTAGRALWIAAAATEKFNGDIAEVIGYQSLLTADEVTRVERYLLDKYAIA